jgi:hypothetical protein
VLFLAPVDCCHVHAGAVFVWLSGYLSGWLLLSYVHTYVPIRTHVHVLAGQGLLLDSRDMGASGRVQNVMAAYMSARNRAQQLQTHWARTTPSSCSQGKASLCGRDISNDAGTLSIMASPAVYDSRLPQHTGKWTAAAVAWLLVCALVKLMRALHAGKCHMTVMLLTAWMTIVAFPAGQAVQCTDCIG